MTKEIGNKLFFIIIVIFWFFLCSCQKNEEFNLEKYNEMFFSELKEKCEGDCINVSKLELYYYDNHYYYEINLHGENRDFDYEWLYVYWHGDLDIWFSIKYPEKNEKYFPKEYFDFLKAKEYDESKKYTKEEIDELLKKYHITCGV